MTEIFQLPAAALLAGYRDKTLSPVEVARATLERIRRLNPDYKAFVLIAGEAELLAQAEGSERRWREGNALPLDGVPVTIKDDVNVTGWPTREGSLLTSDKPAGEDSPPVARLREAGAVFLGKTATPEFGHKGVTDSKLTGITRNPWDKSKTPGGSSGGAAVAAALRMGWLHLGGDGGGSVRIPASFCGVTGFKPTQGLIPRQPQNLFSSLATAGPLARSAEDAALMLNEIARSDPRDGGAVPFARPDYVAALKDRPQGLRIAYAPTINDTQVAPDVAKLVADAAGKLQAIGTVEQITLDIPELVETFNRHWMAVASWLVRQFPEERRQDMDPQLLRWAGWGEALSLHDYLDAELERLRIIDRMTALFNEYDALILPTMAITAFDTGLNDAPGPDGRPWRDWSPFTYLANLAKLPAVSVPCGLADNGLPAGVQIVGGALQDATVLRIANVLELESGFFDRLDRLPA